jgi:hypothetical protein
MEKLKLFTETGEKNLETLNHNRFRFRFTNGFELPEWRVLRVEEINPHAIIVTISIMVGENPQEIINDMSRKADNKVDMILEFLDNNEKVVYTQPRTGYSYAGAICNSFKAALNDDSPLLLSLKFTSK